MRTIAIAVLVIFGAIGAFLGYQAVPTLHHYGFRFFTERHWNPESNTVGILSAVAGTIEVAVIALAVAVPLALGTALFITEYAPARLRAACVAVVDLMAAVPSVIYGLWGYSLLKNEVYPISRWLDQYLGFLPFFHVNGGNPGAAQWAQSRYTGSMFIAGLCVAMMVIPIACSVMRGVFAQAPLGEREAALALGSTRWGMIRTVVVPFGRGGIIGGTMLGLGRALGETVAVLLILAQADDLKIRVTEVGGTTISSLIANSFGDATSLQLEALLTAGFVLFLMTLAVNTAAAVIVSRSRSGATTEI